MHHKRRVGFTIIELLVCLSVAGILIALFLPALQRARAASRAVVCKNNLRQLALSLHSYSSVHGVLPPGSQVQDFLRPPGYSKSFPWLVAILPFIDQVPLYSKFDFDLDCQIHHRNLTSVKINTFMCAADARAGDVLWVRPGGPHPVWGVYYDGSWGTTDYLGCSGVGGPMTIRHFEQCSQLDREFGAPRLDAGVLFGNSSVRFAEVSDGLSNTLAIVERGVTESWGKWGGAGSLLSCPLGVLDVVMPGVMGDSQGGVRPPANSTSDRLFLWSWHDGGTFSGSCDGTVRLMSYEMDHTFLKALSTRGGGEVVSEW